ncbi:LLM class flavin-dependent oxidoreductase [Candidatus Marinarcus aquaticus]|uniref:Luciferase-like domain-containing protein n=1 Tax=Candidatus Marinarcus aquaticus TaxID=2044504 RepID=A0A4Q0XTQ3_9BACT|nr:LLM class flavin-dependent oxidoreductase [Candidatus Marinarcus aquaticus]RXJ60910.1 hypothetical protein CRV04_02545 [Candidatus Marinarcus aquaticus]
MTYGLLLLFEHQENLQSTLNKQINLIKLFDKVIERVWVTEHHYHPMRVNSAPLMILNHLIQHTQKELGVATLLLGFYDPVYTAENISMLSHLAQRKIHIGVAKGGRSEVKNSHLNLTEQSARHFMLQNLNTIQPILRNEKVHYQTKAFTLSPQVNHPIEFSVASLNDDVIQYAALHDLPLMAGHKWSLDEIQQMILTYKLFHLHNKKPKIILARIFCPTHDKQTVIQSIKEQTDKNRALVAQFNPNHEPKQLNEVIFEESLIGSIDEIHSKINHLKSLGVEHIILRPVMNKLNTNDIEKTLGVLL